VNYEFDVVAIHVEQWIAAAHRGISVSAILHLPDCGMKTERLFAGIEAKS
jgi:hypothetical protein